MKAVEAHFKIGQIVHHKIYDYRGVIVDVDPEFSLSPEWYEKVAVIRPAKDQPWYHLLVDNEVYMTYVAEENLEPDLLGGQVAHPLVDEFFSDFKEGLYIRRGNVV